MKSSYNVVFAIVAVILFAVPGFATVTTYSLADHIDGNQNPPSYGLRLDGLLGSGGVFTFSFDHDDGNEQADMKLEFDDSDMSVRISGRAYGGRDTGTEWDATDQGWVDVDFTYTVNVIMADNADGDPGNDLYVTGQDPLNAGAITLDGWGGGDTYSLSDKANTSGTSFRFDNDYDPRDPVAEANPMIVSGAGWLLIDGQDFSGSQDWLFVAEIDAPTPVEAATWGGIKGLYRR